MLSTSTLDSSVYFVDEESEDWRLENVLEEVHVVRTGTRVRSPMPDLPDAGAPALVVSWHQFQSSH